MISIAFKNSFSNYNKNDVLNINKLIYKENKELLDLIP